MILFPDTRFALFPEGKTLPFLSIAALPPGGLLSVGTNACQTLYMLVLKSYGDVTVVVYHYIGTR